MRWPTGVIVTRGPSVEVPEVAQDAHGVVPVDHKEAARMAQARCVSTQQVHYRRGDEVIVLKHQQVRANLACLLKPVGDVGHFQPRRPVRCSWHDRRTQSFAS